MAVTPVGNPYVESSDRVSDYPGASEALAERIDIVGVNPFANAAARDAAIPSPVQGQMCSLNDDNKGYRYDGSEWVLFSGAGPGNFTNTATGTFSAGGIDYKYITFTGSGELIVDQAGFADILVIGGGAGGGNSGNTYTTSGGAGGMLELSSVFFSAGSHSVTVGAGGVGSVGYAGSSGVDSLLGDYVAVGGGGGTASGSTLLVGIPGGSGSGAILATLSKGVTNQGNAGGTRSGGTGNAAGGGAGGAASVSTAGIGRASSITGASVTYAVGGSTATSQTANTGNGCGGAGSVVNGNSGLVIVRVVV